MGNSISELNEETVVPQKDRVVIVTGANIGLGLSAVKALAEFGATVVLACRSMEKGEAAVQLVKDELDNQDLPLHVMELDLAKQASVRAFVESFRSRFERLDTLMNNAGIMALPELTLSEMGLEQQITTNHFGHFTLTMLLLELLEQSEAPRIVNLSSYAHNMADFEEDITKESLAYETQRRYDPWGSYGRSKLANVLFTQRLQKYIDEHEGKTVVYAVHPGMVNTNLMSSTGYPEWAQNMLRPFMRSAENGAKTQVRCAVAKDLADVKGKYFQDEREKEANKKLAGNEKHEEQLWELSFELTGVKEVKPFVFVVEEVEGKADEEDEEVDEKDGEVVKEVEVEA